MEQTKARFSLPELTGDRFPLPVNTGRVDGRTFPLAELTGRQHGPSTRLVETELNPDSMIEPACVWLD